jgi:hypothetical protein
VISKLHVIAHCFRTHDINENVPQRHRVTNAPRSGSPHLSTAQCDRAPLQPPHASPIPKNLKPSETLPQAHSPRPAHTLPSPSPTRYLSRPTTHSRLQINPNQSKIPTTLQNPNAERFAHCHSTQHPTPPKPTPRSPPKKRTTHPYIQTPPKPICRKIRAVNHQPHLESAQNQLQ